MRWNNVQCSTVIFSFYVRSNLMYSWIPIWRNIGGRCKGLRGILDTSTMPCGRSCSRNVRLAFLVYDAIWLRVFVTGGRHTRRRPRTRHPRYNINPHQQTTAALMVRPTCMMWCRSVASCAAVSATRGLRRAVGVS